MLEELVFAVSEFYVGEQGEKRRGCDFGYQRCQSRAADAHLRKAPFAENQAVVEDDVHHSHQNGGVGDDFCVGKPCVQSAKEVVEAHENDAKLAKSDVFHRSGVDSVRFDDKIEQRARKQPHYRKQQQSEDQNRHSTMLEDAADLAVFSSAETSGDDDLDANGQAHRHGGEHEIIHARHHRGAQCHHAEMPQKSRVGERDKRLCQVSNHNRHRNAPDFFCRYAFLHNTMQKYKIL